MNSAVVVAGCVITMADKVMASIAAIGDICDIPTIAVSVSAKSDQTEQELPDPDDSPKDGTRNVKRIHRVPH